MAGEIQADRPSLAQRLATDAILAGAIPAAGYVFAYAYEAGYLSHFGIPFALARATPSGVLEALLRLALVAVPAWLSFYLWDGLVNTQTPVGRTVDRFFRSSALMFFFELPLLKHDPRSVLWLLGGMAAYAVLYFVAPLLQKGKTYRERLAAQETAERRALGLGDAGRRVLARPLFDVALVVLIGLLLTWNVGRGDAIGQRDFLVVKDTDTVVLRAYGDLALVARFSRESGVVERDFAVIQVTSTAGDQLHLVEVHNLGPLTPAPQTGG